MNALQMGPCFTAHALHLRPAIINSSTTHTQYLARWRDEAPVTIDRGRMVESMVECATAELMVEGAALEERAKVVF